MPHQKRDPKGHQIDPKLIPTIAGLVAGFLFGWYVGFQPGTSEVVVLAVAGVINFLGGLVTPPVNPTIERGVSFFNGLGIWSVLLLAVRAGGYNLPFTVALVTVVLAALLVIFVLKRLS